MDAKQIENFLYNFLSTKRRVTQSSVEIGSSITYVAKIDKKLSLSLRRQLRAQCLAKGFTVTIHQSETLHLTLSSKRRRRRRRTTKSSSTTIKSIPSIFFLVKSEDLGMYWTQYFSPNCQPIKIFVNDEDFTSAITGSTRLTSYAYWYLSTYPIGESPVMARHSFKNSQKNARLQEEFRRVKPKSPKNKQITKNDRKGLGLYVQPPTYQGPEEYSPSKGRDLYNKMFVKADVSHPSEQCESQDQNTVDENKPVPTSQVPSAFQLDYAEIEKSSALDKLSDPVLLRSIVLYIMLRSERYPKLHYPFDEYILGCSIRGKGLPLDVAKLTELVNAAVGTQWHARGTDVRSKTPPLEQMEKFYAKQYERH